MKKLSKAEISCGDGNSLVYRIYESDGEIFLRFAIFSGDTVFLQFTTICSPRAIFLR
ncbi:MAG: hypothetical protein L6V93_16820 [Clostridiales bacterium]|nr:MAG: hypothetical protein L6V93_16820 [Clostridiales bacterium]